MYDKEFEKLFELAKDKVDDIEIYLSAGRSFSVRVHKQNVESFNYADSKGIGIRIVKNGKVGYAYTEEFSDEAYRTIIDEAVSSSIYVENVDPIVIANHPDIENLPEIYSKGLDEVSVEAKIALAKKIEQIASEKDKRIFNVPGSSYTDGSRYVRIANSAGLDKEYQSNYCMASVMVLANSGDEKKSGFGYYVGRDFSALEPDRIAAKAVTQAIDLLNSTSPGSGHYPIVFDNEMTAALLGTFSGIFSAKNIQEGKSLLKGKIGEQIANSKVTIVDDGLFAEGLATSPFDDEGFPTQRTVLIDKGMLKSYLHNTATALKEGAVSTGNASRDIRNPLTVAKSNLIIEPGETTPEELRKSYEQVIEVVSLQGLHSGANPISGDFSLSGEGFLYENGVRTKSLSNFTISGNFYKMLGDIVGIGNDFHMNYTSCGTPSILIEKLSISSK